MINNPVLRGFCPDPSIIRVGLDYYIATSTFEWWPGVKLFHSTDLVNWERIPSPLRRESQLELLGDPCSGGLWAPCLTYDGERFFLVFTDVKTKKGIYYNTHNYVVTAKDIRGEWSEPVYLNSIGFDPSLFHDTDGRKYLVNMVNGFKGVLVQEVEPETFAFIGEQKKVYGGSGLGYTEGPHIYHINDWYYLIAAEGGTSYEHCVTAARAKSVWGPFETMPDNPLLTSDRNNPDALQKCGHGDIVQTADGEWYIAHLCSRPLGSGAGCLLGRETALQKLILDDDGWFHLASGGIYAQKETASLKGAENAAAKPLDFFTDFDEETLDVRLMSPRVPLKGDTTSRKGFLRLTARESLNSLHRVSLCVVNQQELCAQARTIMDFSPEYPEQAAGLVYGYDALNFYLLCRTVGENGEPLLRLLKSDGGSITDACEPAKISSGVLALFVQTAQDGETAAFSYELDGERRCMGEPLSVGMLTDEHCRGFTGAFFGLYAHDLTGRGICADFDCLEVRYAEAGI